MATKVIMPALGMAQETGKVLRWLKAAGDAVAKGEPLAEIETDKATVELEAPAAGVLASVNAAVGTDIPVGQVIALLLAPGELPPETAGEPPATSQVAEPPASRETRDRGIAVSPLAARMLAEHHLDAGQVKARGGRIRRADVLAYVQEQERARQAAAPTKIASEPQAGRARAESEKQAAIPVGTANGARRVAASPKARRLAAERGLDLAALRGSGPGGAVLAADVLAGRGGVGEAVEVVGGALQGSGEGRPSSLSDSERFEEGSAERETVLSTVWRLMAERTTQSWTSVPHFFLLREALAQRLVAWREQAQRRFSQQITYSDLLVLLVAATLREHPHLNASWREGRVLLHDEINIGLAVATEAGLVVPVIARADTLGPHEIAQRRVELVERARAGRLRPQDLQAGTFTISNLGMYGVDAFSAIINAPQAAILAVGRLAERVVALHGQPSVQPTIILSLSCDHRVVDGARGAAFLAALASLIEEPPDL